MQQSFKDSVQFTPHFVYWECKGCDAGYINKDCYSGGAYCAIEPNNKALNGRQIIQEDLRQKCLWNSLKEQSQTEKWWKYVQRVHQTCFNVIDDICSQKAHEHLNLNWQTTHKCMLESFTEKEGWEKPTVKNVMIEEEIKYWKEYGTNVYPSIVINYKTYRGQIDPLAVFNALCAGFKDPPQQCLKTLHREQKNDFATVMGLSEDNGVKFTELVSLVLGLVGVNVLVVYCCRRRARREMQGEMQMQIESQVSQYFALTQKAKGD